MRDFCPPDDFFFADDVLEWATDNLELIGAGTAARVFAHPENPELVIRISDYPDGWFLYAHGIMSDDAPSPFAPQVFWMGECGGYLAAVSERLSPLGDDPTSEKARKAEALIYADASDDDLENIAYGLSAFRHKLPARLDVNGGNVMLRGKQIVFNDPLAAIPHAVEAELRESLRRKSTLSDRPSLKF